MATFLSSLASLIQPEPEGPEVDAMLQELQTAPMTNAGDGDLIAVDVHTDDVGDYNVSETGWYAVDDAGKVVLGPFVSLAECDRAILDRRQNTTPEVPN